MFNPFQKAKAVIAAMDLAVHPRVEMFLCIFCWRAYEAPCNTTSESCCPECLAAIERSHGYEEAFGA